MKTIARTPSGLTPAAGAETASRRRVLLVSSSSGSQGGGELYLEGLAAGLVALGHEVESHLAAHPRMDALAARLAPFGRVCRADFTNTYDRRTRAVGSVLARRTIARLAKQLTDFRPDVLHLNKQNLEDGLDLLLAAGRTGLPTTCTIHVTRGMTGLGSMFGGVRDRVARWALRAVRCEYIAVAKAGVGPLLEAVGESGHVHTVWNGIRSVPPGDRAAVRAEWGCGPGHVVIGCVARLEAEKSPLFALELLARLPPHVHLAWIGDGRQREAFLRTARELGVADRVHLDGWRNDARQRSAGLDVFILPSVYEFFPFAVLEAMAAGLPCVASDVGGIGEAVEHGVTGWLCRAGAADEWLARLNGFVADAATRANTGGAGRRRVEEHFTLDAMARGTAAVYEVAIRRTAGAP